MRHQEKASLEQEAKAGLLVGSLVSGLLHHLHVVVMMMAVVMVVAMMVAVMLCHHGRIRARRTDHRRRESECNCKPKSRED
ncbi:hypothetical protein EB233_21920 [Mesorhizobium erdmanii]|uniref:Uncharacterized protein n=1 Tax=Mesorhizobium erdmanii TaxID=1777866 RepID=A0A6M7UIN6_9HYPH|nr:hypothetical protein EB233_21920 [Mesorhizobium erdmanii]